MQQKRVITQTELDFTGDAPKEQEAEQGAVILEKSAFDTVTAILKPECFYAEEKKLLHQPVPYCQERTEVEKKNEILSIHFGKFRLLLINPGNKAMRFILVGMGFLLLAIAFIFMLHCYL